MQDGYQVEKAFFGGRVYAHALFNGRLQTRSWPNLGKRSHIANSTEEIGKMLFASGGVGINKIARELGVCTKTVAKVRRIIQEFRGKPWTER